MKKRQNKQVKDIQEKPATLGDLLDAKLVHELKRKEKRATKSG